MSNINEIVDVTIDIQSPTASSSSYSNILIIGIAPEASGKTPMPDVATISAPGDLLDFGYTVDDALYKAVSVAFAQDPNPETIYVTTRGTSEESGLESVAEVLQRATSVNEWYGVALAGEQSTEDIRTAADWCEANKKMFTFTWTGDTCPIQADAYGMTIPMYTDDMANNTYLGLAYMAKNFGYIPGSETWALKRLNSVLPSTLSASKITALKAIPSNFYHKVGSDSITEEGKVGNGEWIDIIRLRDWLLSEVQRSVFSYLKSQTKVPYNDEGITGVQKAIEAVLMQAQKNGGIDGDQIDEDGKITPGYTVSVPLSANIPAPDKKSRRLRNVTFVARLAGAIHTATIRGTLVY